MTTANLFRLDGSTALVIGAGGGLGSAIAQSLADAGAAVAAADLTAAGVKLVVEGIERGGGRALGVEIDVRELASVERAVGDVETRLGPIDVLVNAAGVTRRGTAAGYPKDEWDRVIAVNLTGVFLASQVVGRKMIERRRGRIISLASIAGQIGLPGTIAYCASKGGVVMLTRALAVEWAQYGIRVNAIAPSWFDTSMGNAIQHDREYAERAMRRVPVGRMGKPDELVGAVVYLASEASAMVTGHILAVDGGVLAS